MEREGEEERGNNREIGRERQKWKGKEKKRGGIMGREGGKDGNKRGREEERGNNRERVRMRGREGRRVILIKQSICCWLPDIIASLYV